MSIKDEMGEDKASEQMDDMWTVREVVRLLHVHPNTLKRWSNYGKIRAYRITRRGDRRFKRQEIARFFAQFNRARDSTRWVR